MMTSSQLPATLKGKKTWANRNGKWHDAVNGKLDFVDGSVCVRGLVLTKQLFSPDQVVSLEHQGSKLVVRTGGEFWVLDFHAFGKAAEDLKSAIAGFLDMPLPARTEFSWLERLGMPGLGLGTSASKPTQTTPAQAEKGPTSSVAKNVKHGCLGCLGLLILLVVIAAIFGNKKSKESDSGGQNQPQTMQAGQDQHDPEASGSKPPAKVAGDRESGPAREDPSALLTITRELGKDGPLHEAAMIGDLATARRLVHRGADVNARGGYGNTPLFYASTDCDQPEFVRFLLESGAKVSIPGDGGDTPLQVAAGTGCIEVVKLLVGAGADVNAMNEGEETPLFEATAAMKYSMNRPVTAGWNPPAVVRFLRSKGAVEEP
jgi:hypothetical protein